MILQEEFIANGYSDILHSGKSDIIDMNDIIDVNGFPEELLGVYISEQKDELFLVLNGNSMDINELCDAWDNRIRVFTIINNKSEHIQKLKYNIVQLIVCSNDCFDRKCERNLLITRKIIIKGDIKGEDRIVIDDREAVGLPFYMVNSNDFSVDEKMLDDLKSLLPNDDGVLASLEKERQKRNGEKMIFTEQEFEKIKEWLER